MLEQNAECRTLTRRVPRELLHPAADDCRPSIAGCVDLQYVHSPRHRRRMSSRCGVRPLRASHIHIGPSINEPESRSLHLSRRFGPREREYRSNGKL